MGYHSATALTSRNIKMKPQIILCFLVLAALIFAAGTSSFPTNEDPFEEDLGEDYTTTTPAPIIGKFKFPRTRSISKVVGHLAEGPIRTYVCRDPFEDEQAMKARGFYIPTSPPFFATRIEGKDGNQLKSYICRVRGMNLRKKRSFLLPMSFLTRLVTTKLDLATVLDDIEIPPTAETEAEHQRERRDLHKTWPMLILGGFPGQIGLLHLRPKSDVKIPPSTETDAEAQHHRKQRDLDITWPMLILGDFPGQLVGDIFLQPKSDE